MGDKAIQRGLDGAVPSLATTENHLYFPALDGVRAAAFLCVFGAHYGNLPWGWGGVDLFFVLSGFLITGILYDTREKAHKVWNFYIRRTLRIFPLFYGVWIALLLLYPFLKWDWNWSWIIWPLYVGNFAGMVHPLPLGSPAYMLAFGQLVSRTHEHAAVSLAPFWSLCVEEQFYLVWPWFVFLIKDRRKLIAICAGLIVACQLLRIVALHFLPDTALASLATSRPDVLLIGALIALLLRGPVRMEKLQQIAQAVFWIAAALIIGWTVVHPPVRHSPTIYPAPLWGFLAFDLLSASVLIVSLSSTSLLNRIFCLKPLRWLGRITYGAYVYHQMFHSQYLWLAWRLAHVTGGPVTASIAFVCTISLAYISFRWFEAPFIRLKSRFTLLDD